MLLADVIKNDIHLLIRRKLMKPLGMKLNFFDQTAYIGDRSVPLTCLATGHY